MRIALVPLLLVLAAPRGAAQSGGVILVQEAKLHASDAAAADRFGWTIALDGERMLVGATGNTLHGVASGAAYVFLRSGSSWTEEARLVPADGGPVHLFGDSVCIEGDRALVGAPNADGVVATTGAVYAWTRAGGTWSLEQKIVAPDGEADERFGKAAALEGDRAVCGAHWDGDAGALAGSAYVFTRASGAWAIEAKLLASDAAAGDELGRAVALSGDRLALGAPYADAGGTDAGAVYVYVRSGAGWVEEAKLTSSHAHANALFGWAVALEEDRLVATAPQCGNCLEPGWASSFVRDASGWREEQLLLPPDGHDFDRYGWSVALEGDALVVGAPYHDAPVESAGAFYVWRLCDGGWHARAKGMASDAFDFDEFTSGVALSGDTIAVGSWRDDDHGSFSGSAYAFRWSDAPPIEPYCFGDADCPCGNHDASAGCTNSTGQGALLAHAAGSTSVTQDDLVLEASHLPPSTPCLLFYGGRSNRLPFGDGLLCAAVRGARLHRFPLRTSDAAGTVREGPGIVAHTRTHFPPAGQLRACETFYFQLWYQDPPGPCASGVSFTNGLAISFVP